MSQLSIESLQDPSLTLDLHGIFANGFGAEALAGVTGMGLPSVSLQWSEGAGDGATFRGKRVLSRDVDIPIHFLARDDAELREFISKWSRIMGHSMRLWFTDGLGARWFLDVYRSGGGGYSYGTDTTGERELTTVVTLTAGDPYWTSEFADQKVISQAVTGRGLIKNTSLVKLTLSSAQVLGSVILENTGDVDSYPVWEIQGPGSDITATSSTGESWTWGGSLAEGETLTIDSRVATAIDGNGNSRYSEFVGTPRFWMVKQGISNANITMSGTGRIVLSWKKRKWAVI